MHDQSNITTCLTLIQTRKTAKQRSTHFKTCARQNLCAGPEPAAATATRASSPQPRPLIVSLARLAHCPLINHHAYAKLEFHCTSVSKQSPGAHNACGCLFVEAFASIMMNGHMQNHALFPIQLLSKSPIDPLQNAAQFTPRAAFLTLCNLPVWAQP